MVHIPVINVTTLLSLTEFLFMGLYESFASKVNEQAFCFVYFTLDAVYKVKPLFIMLVVYFNQQMGARHAVSWSK